MAQKTYLSDRPSISVARAGKADFHFAGGKLVLSEKEDQDFIEGLPSFKNGSIALEAPVDPVAAAVKKAKDLRGVADKAEAEAKAAEAAAAKLLPAPAKEVKIPAKA